MKATEQYVETLITGNLTLKDGLRPPGQVWRASSGKKHYYQECPASKNTHRRQICLYDHVDCSRCLQKMQFVDDPDTHLLWAIGLTETLLQSRGYRCKPNRVRLSTARDHYAAQGVIAQLRSLNETSAAFPVVCRLADVIEKQTLPADTYREQFQKTILATACLWSKFRSRISLTFHQMSDLEMLYPKPQDPRIPAFWSLEAPIHQDLQTMYNRFITDYRDGFDWTEAVTAAMWSSNCLTSVDEAEVMYARQLPDELRFRREDYATTFEWLCDEYRAKLRDSLADLLEGLKTDLCAFTPDEMRMWVTVTVPKRLTDRYNRPPDVYLSWFARVEHQNRSMAQIPLTVLSMLCQLTDTTARMWQPMSGDPLGQATLDVALSLLNRDENLHLLDAYATACAVTGADERAVYGSPDLCLAPETSRPHSETDTDEVLTSSQSDHALTA